MKWPTHRYYANRRVGVGARPPAGSSAGRGASRWPMALYGSGYDAVIACKKTRQTSRYLHLHGAKNLTRFCECIMRRQSR